MHFEPTLFYQTVLSNVCQLIASQRALLYIYHEQERELRAVALWVRTRESAQGTFVGEEEASRETIRLDSADALGAWAVRQRRAMLSGVGRSESVTEMCELCAPLIVQDVLYGAIILQRERPFADQDVNLLRNMSSMIAVTLAQELFFQRVHFEQEQRSNFLSMITHDLRSPLNTINGFLELLLSGVGGELNAQQREFARRARSGSEHLYALMEDLLLLSRADAGQLRLQREVISLAEVVTNAVEELELTAADQHVALHLDIPSPFPYLYADALRLQQVLRNLLSNALRFTPPGGQVTITASVEPVASVQPYLPAIVEAQCMEAEAGGADAAGRTEQVAVLRVSDTGIGIAPEYHTKIFERYFQVSDALSTRNGGQGLGLTIVQKIMELHGGGVIVTSTPGEGSTFSCILPCVLT